MNNLLEVYNRQYSDNRMMIVLLFIAIFVSSLGFYFEIIENFIPLHTSSWDDIIVTFIFFYTLKKVYGNSGYKQSAFFYLLILISIIGIIGNVKTESPMIVILLGLFSFMKPLLLFWSFCQYRFRWGDFMFLMKLFAFFFPVILLSYVLDFLSPEFRQLLDLHGTEIRAGIRSLGGLFRKQTNGVIWAEIYCIYYLYYSIKRSMWKSYVSIAIIIMSLKVKDILALIIGLPTLLMKKIKTLYLFGVLALLFVFFTLYAMLLPRHYKNYFQEDEDSNVARVVMSYTSLKIAKDYFPFGVGFGKFASPTSRDTQSDIYHKYGIDHVYGLTFDYLDDPNRQNYMCDAFWPMILGETGVLGTLCYLCILGCAFFPFLKRYFKNTHDRRVLFPSILFIIFFMTTIGKPVLMGPPHCLVLWGVAGIFYSLKDRQLYRISPHIPYFIELPTSTLKRLFGLIYSP